MCATRQEERVRRYLRRVQTDHEEIRRVGELVVVRDRPSEFVETHRYARRQVGYMLGRMVHKELGGQEFPTVAQFMEAVQWWCREIEGDVDMADMLSECMVFPRTIIDVTDAMTIRLEACGVEGVIEVQVRSGTMAQAWQDIALMSYYHATTENLEPGQWSMDVTGLCSPRVLNGVNMSLLALLPAALVDRYRAATDPGKDLGFSIRPYTWPWSFARVVNDYASFLVPGRGCPAWSDWIMKHVFPDDDYFYVPRQPITFRNLLARGLCDIGDVLRLDERGAKVEGVLADTGKIVMHPNFPTSITKTALQEFWFEATSRPKKEKPSLDELWATVMIKTRRGVVRAKTLQEVFAMRCAWDDMPRVDEAIWDAAKTGAPLRAVTIPWAQKRKEPEAMMMATAIQTIGRGISMIVAGYESLKKLSESYHPSSV